MTLAESMPLACVGFSAIAGLTLFFSYHPRLFVRVFVPRENSREAARTFLRNPNFGRSLRVISLIEFGAAAMFGAAAAWMWLVD